MDTLFLFEFKVYTVSKPDTFGASFGCLPWRDARLIKSLLTDEQMKFGQNQPIIDVRLREVSSYRAVHLKKDCIQGLHVFLLEPTIVPSTLPCQL